MEAGFLKEFYCVDRRWKNSNTQRWIRVGVFKTNEEAENYIVKSKANDKGVGKYQLVLDKLYVCEACDKPIRENTIEWIANKKLPSCITCYFAFKRWVTEHKRISIMMDNTQKSFEIDYNTIDDYIDRECRSCGKLDNKHEVDCVKLARDWLKLAVIHGI